MTQTTSHSGLLRHGRVDQRHLRRVGYSGGRRRCSRFSTPAPIGASLSPVALYPATRSCFRQIHRMLGVLTPASPRHNLPSKSPLSPCALGRLAPEIASQHHVEVLPLRRPPIVHGACAWRWCNKKTPPLA